MHKCTFRLHFLYKLHFLYIHFWCDTNVMYLWTKSGAVTLRGVSVCVCFAYQWPHSLIVMPFWHVQSVSNRSTVTEHCQGNDRVMPPIGTKKISSAGAAVPGRPFQIENLLWDGGGWHEWHRWPVGLGPEGEKDGATNTGLTGHGGQALGLCQTCDPVIVTHGTGDSCLQLLTMITEKRIAHAFWADCPGVQSYIAILYIRWSKLNSCTHTI